MSRGHTDTSASTVRKQNARKVHVTCAQRKSSSTPPDSVDSVCQTSSKTKTNLQRDTSACLFVCLPLCLSGVSVLWVDEERFFIEI